MNGLTKKPKESLNLEQTVFKIPFNNFKPFINRYIFDKWQTSWNETPFNKLKEIKPVIKESKSVISNIRREEVVLTRLRIGHTRITHSWLLNRDEQPNCTGCDVPFTVKHFLLDCFDFHQVRRSFFQVNNLHDLFKDVPIQSIIAFLKEIRGARWLSGRVSDSGARGRGFETYRRRVVSLSKILYSPKVLVNYPGSGGSVPM